MYGNVIVNIEYFVMNTSKISSIVWDCHRIICISSSKKSSPQKEVAPFLLPVGKKDWLMFYLKITSRVSLGECRLLQVKTF